MPPFTLFFAFTPFVVGWTHTDGTFTTRTHAHTHFATHIVVLHTTPVFYVVIFTYTRSFISLPFYLPFYFGSPHKNTHGSLHTHTHTHTFTLPYPFAGLHCTHTPHYYPHLMPFLRCRARCTLVCTLGLVAAFLLPSFPSFPSSFFFFLPSFALCPLPCCWLVWFGMAVLTLVFGTFVCGLPFLVPFLSFCFVLTFRPTTYLTYSFIYTLYQRTFPLWPFTVPHPFCRAVSSYSPGCPTPPRFTLPHL